jgi:TonB family protein
MRKTGFQWWWLASVLVHASLMSAVATAVPAAAVRSNDAVTTFEVQPWNPAAGDDAGVPGATHPTAAPSPRLGGASSAQNVSSDNRGERGDGLSPEQARMLAARDEGVNLDARLLNNLDRTQEQRIRTSRERASPQDDRRTPNPDEDPWVSTGRGVFLVRTTPAREAPGSGETTSAGSFATAGSATPTPPLTAPRTEPNDLPRPTPEGATARAAAGVRDRTQGAARAAAPMATQRPSVEAGHASTTSDQAALRPSDDVDAALLAATLLRAHVNAAAQQGAARGVGEGGVGGGGAPGAGGGLMRGGAARAFGEGDGVLSLTTGDARYQRYFGLLRRRLQALTAGAFPHEDELQLRQGTVILRFVIERDGAVRDVVIERRSGVPGYDANVRSALAAATLPPIPAALARDRLTVRWPAAFVSPVVR